MTPQPEKQKIILVRCFLPLHLILESELLLRFQCIYDLIVLHIGILGRFATHPVTHHRIRSLFYLFYYLSQSIFH